MALRERYGSGQDPCLALNPVSPARTLSALVLRHLAILVHPCPCPVASRPHPRENGGSTAFLPVGPVASLRNPPLTPTSCPQRPGGRSDPSSGSPPQERRVRGRSSDAGPDWGVFRHVPRSGRRYPPEVVGLRRGSCPLSGTGTFTASPRWQAPPPPQPCYRDRCAPDCGGIVSPCTRVGCERGTARGLERIRGPAASVYDDPADGRGPATVSGCRDGTCRELAPLGTA